MAGCPALVLTRDRHARLQIERALRAMDLVVESRASEGELHARLGESGARVIVVDCDELAHEEVEPLLLDAVPRVPVVLIARSPEPETLIALMQRHGLYNLIAKHDVIGGPHPMLDERELIVTCQKLLAPGIFGLDRYVCGCGIVLRESLVASIADKAAFLREFERFVTELRVPVSVISDVVTVADELILNALIHAPRTASGEPKYEESPRALLTMEDAERVPVAYGCDGKRLMLSVADPFGALEKGSITRYVLPALRQHPLPVETKPGGGGLGLAFTVRRCHQMVFNVQPQVRTEVIAGWYIRGPSAREFRQVGKSVNAFWA